MFKCKPNCGQCCGIVPLRKDVCKKYEDRKQREVLQILPTQDDEEVVVATKDGLCVFLKPDKSCAIYDERPDVCRRYGIDPELPCPYVRPNGLPRSPAKVKRMQRLIKKTVDGKLKLIDAHYKFTNFMERRKIIKQMEAEEVAEESDFKGKTGQA